jgi:FtsP/CotA-like multicopper oxidase with cupredoxin domain
VSITRRTFLSAVTGAATAVGLPFASPWRSFAAASTPSRGGPFSQPKVLASTNGRLDVTLVAGRARVPFGDGTRFAYTYNGTTPGPTLRVRPGDVLSVTLENRLGEATNLHTHGLHVSPSGRSDNVFVSVADGGRHRYVYEIPADHRSGTFWYHPHMHEMVAPQVFGGLAGVIVVEDALDALPVLATATERVLVLADPVVGSSPSVVGASMMERMQGREGDVIVVNGVEAPALTATAGSLEHWRIANASPSRYYRLALDGLRMTVIATDGGRLVTPYESAELLVTPGERYEVLVAPSAAGTRRLRSLPYDRGSARMGMGRGATRDQSATSTVLTLQTVGDAPAATLPTSLASPASLALPDATHRRELVLAMGMGGAGGGMGGGMNGGGGRSFTIDGASFDPTTTNIRSTLGRVEDWTVRNTSSMDHPFHLHVWPFQVVGHTGGAALGPGWKDTVNVPAGESVTVRIPFTDLDGRTVYHCHILDHEDLGMMGVIDVS